MREVLIFGDSTCDLPPEWRERLNVGFMPLPVNVGVEPRLDMYNVTPDEIFQHYKDTGELCTTSAPNPIDYVEFWTEQRKARPDSDILHFHISSEMTITYSSARAAAEEFENIWPINTGSVSIGVAQLIIEACKMRDSGMSGQEIFDAIEEMKTRVRVGFVVESLEFLRKGGRCTGLLAMGANLLNLHPAIGMDNGKLKPYKKYRGGMKGVYRALAEDFLSGLRPEGERVIIANTSGDDERFDLIEDIIRQLRPDITEIIRSRPGCSICVHCGPGTVGLAAIEKS